MIDRFDTITISFLDAQNVVSQQHIRSECHWVYQAGLNL